MINYFTDYIKSLQLENKSKVTIDRHSKYLVQFFLWCEENNISNISFVTNKTLDNYQKGIVDNIEFITVRQRSLISLRLYFSWAYKQNHILTNPATNLELPFIPKSLPKDLLTIKEFKRLIKLTGKSNHIKRDRAIFETLFATGVRSSELCNLRLKNINLEDEIVFIEESKFLKDRYIPVSRRALYHLKEYIELDRDKYNQTNSDFVFFLTDFRPMKSKNLSSLINTYFRKAEINKIAGANIFRHTLATNMLENGADIRYIQEMLGHESIKTTQIYTKVSIAKLKEIHQKTHPRK